MFSQTNQKTLDNVLGMENDARELVQIKIIKKELDQRLNDYKSSRTDLTTMLFRNGELTREKLKIVDEMLAFIKNFSGTTDDLLVELKKKRSQNALLSASYGNLHYNLFDKRLKNYTYVCRYGCTHTETYSDVRQGEMSNKSGLADILNDGIAMIDNHKRELSHNRPSLR